MPIINFKDKKFAVDEGGFLKDFADWCPEWVEYVQTTLNLPVITEEHWRLIYILQDCYRANGEPPMARVLSRETGFKMKRIFELFPAGPGKGACMMAGLPKPKGCV